MSGSVPLNFSGFNEFQKVVGAHQGFVIHQPEAGCLHFLNDLGLVAAYVPHHPVRADTRVATKVDDDDASFAAQRLVDGIIGHGHRNVSYCGSLEETAEYLGEVVEKGDLVVTLGAGNVNQVCDLLAKRLKERN